MSHWLLVRGCVLHNICEVQGDDFNESWFEAVIAQEFEPQPTSAISGDGGEEFGSDIRNALVHCF